MVAVVKLMIMMKRREPMFVLVIKKNTSTIIRPRFVHVVGVKNVTKEPGLARVVGVKKKAMIEPGLALVVAVKNATIIRPKFVLVVGVKKKKSTIVEQGHALVVEVKKMTT